MKKGFVPATIVEKGWRRRMVEVPAVRNGGEAEFTSSRCDVSAERANS